MMISKKALSRRTVLRGLGTTLALPVLDSMLPAFTAVARSAAAPVNRFGVMYVPNGMIMQNWAPIGEGIGYQFNTTMVPLAPFRNQMTVISGLNCTPPPGTRAGDGVHARASTRFLTDVYPKITPSGGEIRAGISMDQILAKEMGKHTQLGSLEMAIESTQSAGACDQGYACDYTSTICWRGDTTPMPMENNPRAVFERLFGDTGSTDPKARLSRIEQDRSILDSVTAEVAHLQQSLGHGDRSKLNEYLDAIRDVERRIQKAEEQSGQELPLVAHPAGIPGTYDEHAKLLIDLQVLAYQCDLTRIITLMMGREFSGMTYPHIGVPDAHHPISHHQNQVREGREGRQNQPVPRDAVRLPARQAPRDARWRWLAAGSRDDDVRRRHGRQQPARPRGPAPHTGGRRRGPAEKRPPHPVSRRHAAGQPAPDAVGQVRRAVGSTG